MVVDWERVAKASAKLFLLFLEFCIKISAGVVTAVVLAADGSLGTKLGTGYSSISSALRKLFDAPGDVADAAHLINEYHTLSASAFNEQYGANAINGVLGYLNGGIVYLQDVYQNFASQPFATFFASLIAFSSLYLISLVLRFARQKGQGSYLNRLERRLGERIFESEAQRKRDRAKAKAQKMKKKKKSRLKNRKPSTNGAPASSPNAKSTVQTGNSKSNNFGNNGNSGKVNKHLQEYLRNAQSG